MSDIQWLEIGKFIRCIKWRLISDKLNHFSQMHPMHKLYFLSFHANVGLQIYFYTLESIQNFRKKSILLQNYWEKSIAVSKSLVYQLYWVSFFVKHIDSSKPFGTFLSLQRLLSEEDFISTDNFTMVWEKYNNPHTLGTRQLCPVYDLRHNCAYSSWDVVKKSFKA